MASQFGSPPHYTDKIVCPRCGKAGSIIWEEAGYPGEPKQFIKIEGDFHERLAKKSPHPIELVCNGCGTPQASMQA
jgi:hypothetical protein